MCPWLSVWDKKLIGSWGDLGTVRDLGVALGRLLTWPRQGCIFLGPSPKLGLYRWVMGGAHYGMLPLILLISLKELFIYNELPLWPSTFIPAWKGVLPAFTHCPHDCQCRVRDPPCCRIMVVWVTHQQGEICWHPAQLASYKPRSQLGCATPCICQAMPEEAEPGSVWCPVCLFMSNLSKALGPTPRIMPNTLAAGDIPHQLKHIGVNLDIFLFFVLSFILWATLSAFLKGRIQVIYFSK